MKLKENLQWVAIILIAIAGGLLLLTKEPAGHIVALVLQAIAGVIEGYLIWKGQATITKFYIPLLPKSIDWPLAIIAPIALVVKVILMWTNKETITVWWASAAIIESWIVSHLCSFEREEK